MLVKFRKATWAPPLTGPHPYGHVEAAIIGKMGAPHLDAFLSLCLGMQSLVPCIDEDATSISSLLYINWYLASLESVTHLYTLKYRVSRLTFQTFSCLDNQDDSHSCSMIRKFLLGVFVRSEETVTSYCRLMSFLRSFLQFGGFQKQILLHLLGE